MRAIGISLLLSTALCIALSTTVHVGNPAPDERVECSAAEDEIEDPAPTGIVFTVLPARSQRTFAIASGAEPCPRGI
jgi:hypothetical protein